jgi:serine protease AprX
MNIVHSSFLRKSLVLLLMAVVLFSPFLQAQVTTFASTSLTEDKVDSSFYQELLADDGSLYYDVMIVFNGPNQNKLEVFNRDYHSWELFDMARMVLNKDEILEITNWSEVLFVEPSRQIEYYNAEGRELTNSNYVQKELGYDGSSVEVAVIDTGADGTHPDLENMLYNWQVVGTVLTNVSTYVSTTPDGTDVHAFVIDATLEDGTKVNTDEYGHGTHVFGTIAGTGAASEGHQRGMAPAAKVHSYSTSAAATLPFVVQAYHHMVDQKLAGNTKVQLVNNSWGSSGCEFNPNSAVSRATYRAFEANILSVFAYGNSGPSANTCNPHASAPYVLGVAATDKAYKVTGFSSRGKQDGNYDRELALNNFAEYLNASQVEKDSWNINEKPIGLHRPSVSAPGAGIVSAQNPVHPMTTSGTLYGAASGTSMASPHVAGVATLVIDAYQKTHPGQQLSPLDLIRLIEVTANKEVMFGFDTLDTGAGFVDALKAVTNAVNNNIPTQVTSDDLVTYVPPVISRIAGDSYAGTVLANSWQTNEGYELHEIVVEEGAIKLFADLSWLTEAEKLYISLYAPGRDVMNVNDSSVYSAGLLDVTKYRYVEFNFPEPGIWTVRIDGRINTITDYTGKWEVHYSENAHPTAELSVTPDKVSGNDPISIHAIIADSSGIEDIVKAYVIVRSNNGKIIASWSKEQFEVIDSKTLELVITELAVKGNAPWTVDLYVEDSNGNIARETAFVGRK